MLFDMERNGNTKPPKMKCKINNNNKIALKSCPPPFTPPKKTKQTRAKRNKQTSKNHTKKIDKYTEIPY